MREPGVAAILVTGAAGFIGRACVRELISRGKRVGALIHSSSHPEIEEAAAAGRLDVVRADISDGNALFEALSAWRGRESAGITAVVHCAAYASDVGPRGRFQRANVDGVRNVVACAKHFPACRLVFLSTTDVYGLKDFAMAGEETPFDAHPRNPYPRTKIWAEKHIMENLPEERWVILRPGAVWGPGDTTILPRFLSHLRGSPLVVHFGRWKGRNRWPLAYVDNVARAAVLAAEAPEAGGQAYNVVDSERTSVEEFSRMLLETFLPAKREMGSVAIPFAAGWLLALPSTALSNLFGLEEPLYEPSLYGLRAVSADLDFSCKKLEALFEAHGESFVSREEARAELARAMVL